MAAGDFDVPFRAVEVAGVEVVEEDDFGSPAVGQGIWREEFAFCELFVRGQGGGVDLVAARRGMRDRVAVRLMAAAIRSSSCFIVF
jgi:hypothetical protein